MNKVIIIGRLGSDPRTTYTKNSTCCCKFSIATSETWTKDGEKQQRTEWHNILCWGKLAEIAGKYLAKGRQCCVEGKLQTSSWDGDDGKKRYKTEIVASNVEFLGNKNDADNTGYTPPANTNNGPPAESSGWSENTRDNRVLNGGDTSKASPIDDDDIPF